MNHIKNKLRCRLTDTHIEPSAATVGTHLSALPRVQSVVKELQYAAPSFTSIDCIQYDSWLCTFASLHLIMQNFANLPAIDEHAALSFAPTAHIYDDLWFFSNMFLCCIFIVQCFPASLGTTHIIKEMFVYKYMYIIYIHVLVHYYIYVFPCLQDLARLKIALYILAHAPKSVLDPVIGSLKARARSLRTSDKARCIGQPRAGKRSGLFITRLHPDTSERELDAYIQKATNLRVRSVKLNAKFKSYASFHVPLTRGSWDYTCSTPLSGHRVCLSRILNNGWSANYHL